MQVVETRLIAGVLFLQLRNVGRLRRGRLVRAETAVAMIGSVEDSYRRFLFDTVTHSVPALRYLAQEAGAERVLLGSDYPFDMGVPDPVDRVEAAGLDARDVIAITSGNAAALGITVPTAGVTVGHADHPTGVPS